MGRRQLLVRKQADKRTVTVCPEQPDKGFQTGERAAASENVCIDSQRTSLKDAVFYLRGGSSARYGRINAEDQGPGDLKRFLGFYAAYDLAAVGQAVVADVDSKALQCLAVGVAQQVFNCSVIGAVIIPEQLLENRIDLLKKSAGPCRSACGCFCGGPLQFPAVPCQR